MIYVRAGVHVYLIKTATVEMTIRGGKKKKKNQILEGEKKKNGETAIALYDIIHTHTYICICNIFLFYFV